MSRTNSESFKPKKRKLTNMSFWDLQMDLVLKDEDISSSYLNNKRGFVKIDRKWFLSYKYAAEGDKIYNFSVRPDDTWIISYPRSGTTLMQELVWLVVNNMNFDEANRRYLLERVPFLDAAAVFDKLAKDVPGRLNTEKYSIEYVETRPSPRFIKSHMPLELLPKVVNSTCKMIYIARNPKDVVVSCYNLQKALNNFEGTFEEYCNNFMIGRTLFGPYSEHVKNAWELNKCRPYMLFIFYEDLIKDLPGYIRNIAAFFNKTYSDEQVARLTEHLKIENFRNNPMVNQPSPDIVMPPEKFIRKGITGGWREMFTPEIEMRFDKWIENYFKEMYSYFRL